MALLRWERPKTVVEPMELTKLDDMRKCLTEVGVRLSDVFGADNILWVEGPTEEACFPIILQDAINTAGTSIVSVISTGDLLSKKSKKRIIGIYSKLSESNAILPSTLAFIFDKEKLTDKEIADINRESKGFVHFIPRRTYENYLIHPDALASVMNELPTFKEASISQDIVEDWLVKNGNSFIEGGVTDKEVDITKIAWLENVDGANLLSAMYSELSGNMEDYIKTSDSVLLTKWLIQNKEESLTELKEFLIERLKSD